MPLYRARLSEDCDGVHIIYDEYTVIHESECYYWLVPSHTVSGWLSIMSWRKDLKKKGVKKRMKKCVRQFVYDNKSDALTSLRNRTSRRYTILRGQLAICEAFLSSWQITKDTEVIPGTKEVVNAHFYFD